MRKFDYSFLDNGLLPASIVNLTCGIYSLQSSAEIRKGEFKQVFTELEGVAKIQSVKSSNAIEGIVTTDRRITEIVNGNCVPLNHTEAEIAGYRDALNAIHTGSEKIRFCGQEILKLHEMILSVAGEEDAGKYKITNNVIVEVSSDGTNTVRFHPIPADETKAAMKQLVLAY